MTISTIPKRFKFARGVIWLFLLLTILLPGYTYYRSEIVSHGLRNSVYLKYYLISLIGVLFFGIVLRLKDEIKLATAMITTSLVIGIYLVEIALGLISPIVGSNNFSKLRQTAAEVASVEYDTRTKYQVYRDLKSAGVDVVPSFHLSEQASTTNVVRGSDPLFPLAGVSKKTTVYCNESGNYAIFQSDRHGFNNPDPEWDSPQTEWALTGDSFIQGACVQPGEGIAGQVRSITGESVLNLGNGGNGPLTELGVLKEYAELRKPKNVIWAYYEGNDMSDLEREALNPLLMSYLRPKFSQNLIRRQTEIDSQINKYIMGAEREHSPISQIKLLHLPNIRQQIGFNGPVEPLFIEVLTKARDRVAAWGGKLYFVYLPEFMRYSRKALNHDWLRKRGEIIKIARKLNLSVIDIHQEVFENHPDPLSLFPFRQRGHYTTEGYSEVAQAIVLGVGNEQKAELYK